MAIGSTSNLVISRPRFAGKWFRWDVMLDGFVVDRINDGQRVSRTVSPGSHTVHVVAGRRKQSRPISFDVADTGFIELVASAPQSRRDRRYGKLWHGTPVLRVERWGHGTTFTESR